MNDYLAAILFFLPAGVSNMSPVIANKIPGISEWKTPIDFGKSWGGRRIFGDNKTWRGLIFGTFMGGLSAILVSKLNANTIVTLAPFWVGLLLGFGALAGDALESFAKRRRDIDSGNSWFPFDQLDYIIGGLVIIYPFVALPLWAIVTIVMAYFVLHLVVSGLGFKLKLKDKLI